MFQLLSDPVFVVHAGFTVAAMILSLTLLIGWYRHETRFERARTNRRSVERNRRQQQHARRLAAIRAR